MTPSSRSRLIFIATIPSHVICNWIGNSPQVARKHYLQAIDEHFDRATHNDVNPFSKAAQNAAHSLSAEGSTETPEVGNSKPAQLESIEKNKVILNNANRCSDTQKTLAEMHGNRTHRTQG